MATRPPMERQRRVVIKSLPRVPAITIWNYATQLGRELLRNLMTRSTRCSRLLLLYPKINGWNLVKVLSLSLRPFVKRTTYWESLIPTIPARQPPAVAQARLHRDLGKSGKDVKSFLHKAPYFVYAITIVLFS